MGLCRHVVAGPRHLLCAGRLCDGHVSDASGGRRRSAGVYVLPVVDRAAVVLVGNPALCLGDAAGGAGSRAAGAGFRLVCLSLQNQRGLLFDNDPGADLRRNAALFPQRDRLRRQQRFHRFHHAARLFRHRHRHPCGAVYGDGTAAAVNAVDRLSPRHQQVRPHSDGGARRRKPADVLRLRPARL